MKGGVSYSDLVKMPISGIIDIYRRLIDIKKSEADDIEAAKNTSKR